jgi:indole-3-glycerol phosphate synthase
MSDKLAEICALRADDVAADMARVSLADIKAKAADSDAPRGFAKALQDAYASGRPGLIAEIKKASPSQGVIRADFDHLALAREYAAGGADCLSVLTEPHYFLGQDSYIAAIRQAVPCPILRKDFMVAPYQIYQSRALGADCVLLIMAALSDDSAAELAGIAAELSLDVLVEVHDAAELARAKTLSPTLIGVNARNLKTLKVDLQTSFDLAEDLPVNSLKIAESGIKTPDEALALYKAGYQGFLIGESLLRQGDVTNAIKILLGPFDS